MAVTYILFSQKRQKFYVGSSRKNNINTRLYAHNSNSVRSTKSGTPWTVVEVERFNGYTDARRRELFLKSGVGRKEIQGKFGQIKTK